MADENGFLKVSADSGSADSLSAYSGLVPKKQTIGAERETNEQRVSRVLNNLPYETRSETLESIRFALESFQEIIRIARKKKVAMGGLKGAERESEVKEAVTEFLGEEETGQLKQEKIDPNLVLDPHYLPRLLRILGAKADSITDLADPLFSSISTPAAFKEQLALNSLLAPTENDIAKIMSLKNGASMSLKLDGCIYRVERIDKKKLKLNVHKLTWLEKAIEISKEKIEQIELQGEFRAPFDEKNERFKAEQTRHQMLVNRIVFTTELLYDISGDSLQDPRDTKACPNKLKEHPLDVMGRYMFERNDCYDFCKLALSLAKGPPYSKNGLTQTSRKYFFSEKKDTSIAEMVPEEGSSIDRLIQEEKKIIDRLTPEEIKAINGGARTGLNLGEWGDGDLILTYSIADSDKRNPRPGVKEDYSGWHWGVYIGGYVYHFDGHVRKTPLANFVEAGGAIRLVKTPETKTSDIYVRETNKSQKNSTFRAKQPQ
ncbi:MAG: hypothetical protein V1909_01990 [Candidatus Micrarchaeota archaeon]